MDVEGKFEAEKSMFPALAVFLLFVLLGGVAGRLLFDRYEQQAKTEASSSLAHAGKLRASQLAAFLKERKGDARVASDLLGAGLAQTWWQGGDKDLPAMLRRTLNLILAEHDYTGAMLVDTGGEIRFSAGRSISLSAAGKSMALRALGKASPAFSDLYFADAAAPQKLMLDTFAPIMSADRTRAVGILVLRGDWDHAFSAFRPWPEDSRSAEFLLVRKDGADVLFLNQLRHQEQAADRLRMPLTGDMRSPAWPAIRAVQGHYGALESVDYRGEAILAYTLPIADTDWSMVLKEDVAEALEGIRHIERTATYLFLAVVALVFALWWWWLRWRRSAEQALRESRERFEKAFQASPDSITLVTLDNGTFVEVNDSFERFTGYSRAEAMGRNARDLKLWTNPAQREYLYAELRAGRAVSGLEALIRRKDGEMRVGLRFATRVEIGGVQHVLSIMRDITEQKKAEAALRASEEKFSKAFHASPDSIALSKMETGEFIEVNEGFEHISGYSREEAIGRTAMELGLWTQTDQRATLIAQLASGGAVRNLETVLRRKDGAERVILLWLETIDLAGEKCMLTIGHDVTERVQAVETMRLSSERLKQAQRIGRLGYLDWDLATNDLVLSEETVAIYRLDKEKKTYALEEIVSLLHPDDREHVEKSLQAAIAGSAKYDLEHRMICHDGTEIHVRATAELIRDHEGKPVRLLGTVLDITDRKHAEEEILKLNTELERRIQERTANLEAANQELETFTYSVAHDLRAPLRGIDGYSRLLLAEYADKLDEEGRQFLQNVRQAAQQMGELINDLLAYSHLERRDLRTDKFNPQALIEALLAERADEIKARGVAVKVAVSCPSVTADRDGLAMALRNLLENALKFTCNVPQAMIEIGGRDTGTACIFSVRDNGIGFDMKYHDRIFSIFQRLQRSEDYPGTGVGLAIVKKAMERMGGRAWAESEPGKGATFYLEIPE
jgi:PAS domain S-box-containing protein